MLLRNRLEEHGTAEAIWFRKDFQRYGELIDALDRWTGVIASAGVTPGSVVAIESDFSPDAVALFLSLADLGCLVVPLTTSGGAHSADFKRIAEVEWVIDPDALDGDPCGKTGVDATHPLYERLREAKHAGLVLFSSGSTGTHKAVVHDLPALMAKFKRRRASLRTVAFLLFDHIGGVNTMLHVLLNGGTLIVPENHDPASVCAAIAAARAQVLPTSPTFLNLLLLSEVHTHYDLESLERITYGTEPMPASLLQRLRAVFPGVVLQQTYGLSEVGIVQSKSRSDESLWMRIGGEGFETRIVDNVLQIKAASAMLGYLNHPSPFSADGWFVTGDIVESDGDYIRILGRRSEVINVGGEKVFPIEVENVLQQMPGVVDASVRGETNPLTGQCVVATVQLSSGETLSEFRTRMRAYCKDRLARFKIPQKVLLASSELHGGRFKKDRLRA